MNIKLVSYAALIVLLLFPDISRAEKVGVILTRGSEFNNKTHSAFMSYLTEKGYGDRIKFITQNPYPDPVAWKNASRKILAADVDVIVTYGSAPTISTIQEKSSTPIIFSGVYLPVADSLRSKNVTGACYTTNLTGIIRYMREAEALEDMVVLYCDLEQDSSILFSEMRNLSSKYGFTLRGINIKKAVDMTEALVGQHAGSYLITPSLTIGSVLNSALQIASANKIPTVSLLMNEKQPAVITMTPDAEEQGRETARKLIAIIDGTPMKNIPYSCTKNYDLVLNLVEARKVNMKVPLSVINDATRIIK